MSSSMTQLPVGMVTGPGTRTGHPAWHAEPAAHGRFDLFQELGVWRWLRPDTIYAPLMGPVPAQWIRYRHLS
jgi:hypothetical protein